MLTGTMHGFLIMLILVTLAILLLTLWVPVSDAIYYGKRSIVVLGWLWLALALPTLGVARVVQWRRTTRSRT